MLGGDKLGAQSAVVEVDDFGSLISDPEVFRELGISPMTGWRWDRDPRMQALGWPVAIYRGRFKFRDSKQYERFRRNLMRQAIAKRDVLLAGQSK
jgi:hypothetical protein